MARSRKVLKLQEWIKKTFPIVEENGLHSTGHSLGHSFITIQFMDNDFGVWIILCADYDSTQGDHKRRLNIGTYYTKRAVKKFLKSFVGY